jgi:hypothetical protein
VAAHAEETGASRRHRNRAPKPQEERTIRSVKRAWMIGHIMTEQADLHGSRSEDARRTEQLQIMRQLRATRARTSLLKERTQHTREAHQKQGPEADTCEHKTLEEIMNYTEQLHNTRRSNPEHMEETIAAVESAQTPAGGRIDSQVTRGIIRALGETLRA